MRLWTLPALCMFGVCQLAAQVERLDPPTETETPPAERGPGEEVSAPSGEAARIEAFVDGLMAAQFEAYRLAGAAVSIVRGDEPVLIKGYGYADLEKRTPVDPETTLFAVASITKLFTWTGVMRLAEEGRLDLSADLNRYLKSVRIPETFPRPVTMLDLLAHTAGFEDRHLRLFSLSTDTLRPPAELLRGDLPRRVRPPGEVPAYSNHGAALAGVAIQDITGVPWPDYLERHIFGPLEMMNTSVRQPVPPELGDAAKGYRFTRRGMTVQPPEYVPLAPAGSARSTAADMARFMSAHLQLGRYRDRRVLGEATAARMRSVLFEADPRVGGMAHGFVTRRVGGRQVIGHGGDTLFFHSGLFLVPDENLGIFVSYNAEEGGKARSEAVGALLGFLLPIEVEEAPDPLPGFAERAEGIVGSYRSSRRPRTTLDKFGEIFGYLIVEVVEEGVLRTSSMDQSVRLWVETEPFLFVARDSGETLFFQEDEEGEMRAFLGDQGYAAHEKLRWWQTPGFQGTLLLLNLLLLVSTFLLPAIDVLINWRTERMLARREPAHSSARWLASLVSGAYMLFLAGLVIGMPDPYVLLYGVPPFLVTWLVVPLVGGFLTVVMVVVAALAWRGRFWSVGARLHYSCVAAAAVALLWQLNYWNLLGWKFH
jgi:CubicO group peptidase (beta-lactamase class C family)